MILIYIFSILSLSSLFMERTQPQIQVNQWQEAVNNNIKVTTKTEKKQTLNQVDSWLDENKSEDVVTENQDIQENNEEYEEIIFQDDFDKEYRMGTEDNYLEE